MAKVPSLFGSRKAEKSAVNEGRKIAEQARREVESCKDERPLWEAQVAVCEHFAAGNHRVSINRISGAVETHPLVDGQIWRTINLWPSTLSVITTRLTANDPRWNPVKAPLTSVTDAEVDAANAALQKIWSGSGDNDRSVKREMKRSIRSAYKQGRRLLYMRFDDELNLPVLDSFSLWDVYSDPSSNDLCKKRWLRIILPKNIEWIESMYPEAKSLGLKTDSRMAESKLQEEWIKTKTGASRNESKTVNVIYSFRVTSVDEEWEEWDEEYEEDDNGAVTVKKTNAKTFKKPKSVIRHEVIIEAGEKGNPIVFSKDIDYPSLADIFDSFSPRDDEDWHARPPCVDWIDPSKTIDKAYSSIEAYMDMFEQGRWILTRKNVDIPVGGVHGQKIFAQPGDIQMLPTPPLPATHFRQLENGLSQFQQITGVHGASLGNMPSGDTSGKALAQASALDEQNSSDDVDNFKMCLERVAVKMLRLMADNWDQVETIYRYDESTGESREMKVIGEKYYDSLDEDEKATTTMIRPFKRIDVEIITGPFFKSVHKQEMLVQILNTGWQPGLNPIQDKVILDTIDIGVGRDIVRELKKMRNPQLMIADGKAMLIKDGESVAIARNDPHQFLQEFYAKKAKEALESGDQRSASMLNAQAQKHAMFIKRGIGSVGTPDAPTSLEEFANPEGVQGNVGEDVPPEIQRADEQT